MITSVAITDMTTGTTTTVSPEGCWPRRSAGLYSGQLEVAQVSPRVQK
jgi:hypothetical protein